MILRFRVFPQVLFAFVLAASFPLGARADSWGQRTDIGVAALDRKTGKVLWEAWQSDQIPDGLSRAGKAKVKSFLPDSKPSSEIIPPDLPTAVGRDRVVDLVSGEEERPHFVLAHGKPDAIGAEIARFPFDDDSRWRYQLHNGTLYCLRDAQVFALLTTIKEDPKDRKWKPHWTFDLLAEFPVQEHEGAKLLPMDLHVNAKGVWVVHGPRILQLTPEGVTRAQYRLKRVPLTWFDHYQGTPLTFGKDLIYYRSANVVIALDWQRKQEVWRLETTLSPTVSAVAEIDEDLVLVQIGSYVPRTIQEALENKADPSRKSPRSTKERIAAARLLHSYGDGYLRKRLREYRDELGKKRNDEEAKRAVAVLDDLLGTWPRKRDQQRLINSCVSALLQNEEKEPHRIFASPAEQRLLTWSLLRNLIDGWHGDDEAVTKLVAHCRHVLATGPQAERPFAASVLLARRVGWFRLTDSERKQLFLSRDASIWQETAATLVNNGWREELIQWAAERPAEDHPDLLLILSRQPVKKWSSAERKLWLSCAREHPGRVAYLLNGLEMEGDVSADFRPLIRTYLEKEIARPTVKKGGEQEAYDLWAALEVLDRWKMPEDTALLRKYLHHPCEGMNQFIQGMLKQRSVELPPDRDRKQGPSDPKSFG